MTSLTLTGDVKAHFGVRVADADLTPLEQPAANLTGGIADAEGFWMFKGADFFTGAQDNERGEMMLFTSDTRRVVRAGEVLNILTKSDSAEVIELFFWARVLVLHG